MAQLTITLTTSPTEAATSIVSTIRKAVSGATKAIGDAIENGDPKAVQGLFAVKDLIDHWIADHLGKSRPGRSPGSDDDSTH